MAYLEVWWLLSGNSTSVFDRLDNFLFYFILFQSFNLRSPGAALSRICLERASNVLISICNIFATGGFFFSTVLHSLNFSCQNFISCYFLFYFHPTFFFKNNKCHAGLITTTPCCDHALFVFICLFWLASVFTQPF